MSAWYVVGLQSKAEDKEVCDVPWYERSFAVANNTEPAGIFSISLTKSKSNWFKFYTYSSIILKWITDTETIKPNDSNKPDTDSTQPVQTTTSASSQPNADTRISCPFGINCYRKNPQHKIDEAHPGDVDYIVSSLRILLQTWKQKWGYISKVVESTLIVSSVITGSIKRGGRRCNG